MHELSIAMIIVDIASREASRHADKTIAVHMQLGALSGVVKESLLSAWELARTNSPLEAAALIIEEVPVVAFCPSCQAEREIASVQRFYCSNCGSPLNEVVHGRELEIVALELHT